MTTTTTPTPEEWQTFLETAWGAGAAIMGARTAEEIQADMTTKEQCDPSIHARSRAYCKGFLDGYDHGINENPYSSERRNKHLLYKIGYDAGLHEYNDMQYPNKEGRA